MSSQPSQPVDLVEPDYQIDDEPLSDSHLKDLYLRTRVCGVLYHRDNDGKAAATVLLEIGFSLPKRTEMGKFNALPTLCDHT